LSSLGWLGCNAIAGIQQGDLVVPTDSGGAETESMDVTVSAKVTCTPWLDGG
jgi:hypothetical protein